MLCEPQENQSVAQLTLHSVYPLAFCCDAHSIFSAPWVLMSHIGYAV